MSRPAMVDALAILKLISHSERSIELHDAETHEEVVGALRQVLSSGQESVRNRRVPSLLPIPPQQVSHMDVSSSCEPGPCSLRDDAHTTLYFSPVWA